LRPFLLLLELIDFEAEFAFLAAASPPLSSFVARDAEVFEVS
jgi:hypothetical protein